MPSSGDRGMNKSLIFKEVTILLGRQAYKIQLDKGISVVGSSNLGSLIIMAKTYTVLIICQELSQILY